MRDLAVNDTRARTPASFPEARAGAPVLDPQARATLEEARECLAYWEQRERALPLHAIAQRREARTMAARWRARAAQAEREAYGQGLLGALLLLAAERRVPEPTRHAGRRVIKAGTRAAIALAVLMVLMVLAVLAVAAELLITVF